MSDQSPPNQPDPAVQLPRDLYLQVVDELRRGLPLPATDTPEAWLRRDRVAIARVAAMLPTNCDEADLAASCVSAAAHAKDCMRLAVRDADDPKLHGQNLAQAASMGREARGYRATLLRVQAARQKREANDATREAAAWTEQCRLSEMTDALESLPPSRPEPRPAAPAEPSAAAVTAAVTAPRTAAVAAAPPLSPEEVAEIARVEYLEWEADRYTILNQRRVQLIRKLGGLPPDCDYEPPRPELLHLLITSNSPPMRLADKVLPLAARPAAAI